MLIVEAINYNILHHENYFIIPYMSVLFHIFLFLYVYITN